MANSPLKAIKEKCIDCMGGQQRLVKDCPCQNCPLFEYRSGKSNRKRTLTDEQRQAAAERLKKAREEKNKNS